MMHKLRLVGILLSAVFTVAAARAQPAAILDDLGRRAQAAIDKLEHAHTTEELRASRQQIRSRLEQSLRWGSDMSPQGAVKATLHLPHTSGGRLPAVLHLRLHQNADAENYDQVLCAVGVIVLSLDLRSEHDSLGLLRQGTVPEQVFQRAVRGALANLFSRSDVDRNRIGIVGSGFAVTVAAALNPEISAVVVRDGIPNWREYVRDAQLTSQAGSFDSCTLIPALLQYASTKEIFSLVAPRPMLVSNAPPEVMNHGDEVYSSVGASERVMWARSAGDPEQQARTECEWFARWLLVRPTARAMEGGEQAPPIQILIPQVNINAAEQSGRLSLSTLVESLGALLPEARMTMALKIAPKQGITLLTQPNLRIPVSVFRPGPEGGNAARGVLVAIHDQGKENLDRDPVIQEARQHGWLVWTIDPRGIGELTTGRDDFVFLVSLLLGENFAWRQASDVTRIIQFVGKTSPGRPSGLYASGKLSSLVALYSATMLGAGFSEWMILRDPPSSLVGDNIGMPDYTVNYGRYRFGVAELLQAPIPRIIFANAVEDIQLPW